MENEELFTKINELFPPDFSKENLELYVDYIQCCYNFSIISNDFDFSSLINYISSNFYSLPEEKFLKLPLEMQYSIISNPHLQIASEDSLLDTVMQIINGIDDNSLKSQDEIEKVLFLEHIEFTSLSEEKLREFLSVFDFNSITSSLWKKLYECFFIHFDKKPERFVNRMSEKLTFEYIENQTGKLEGIIHYLSEKFGGNIVDKGICKVTSSSVFKNFYPKNVIDFNKLCLFTSDSTIDAVDPWLKIDFLGRKIHPTHYTIRTVGNKRNGCHLKNWVFECSNTDKNDDWIILDSRNNVDSLNNSLAIETFDIKENIDDNEYFRYFRIRQTGLNCSNTNQLAFCSLGLFGTII